MMLPSDLQFQLHLEQCYSDGYAFHGDLGLKFEDYRIHLLSILDKYSRSDMVGRSACCFLEVLFTTDLYLSTACSVVSERAWDRFAVIYRPVIAGFALSACHRQDLAAELAADVLTHMFLPDRSGRIRIGSFDGKSPLSAWLRVIVNNNAVNERERKCNNFQSVEGLQQMEGGGGILFLEQSLRANTYGSAITEALRLAVESLTAAERRLLLLRYDEELRVSEIAREMALSSVHTRRRIEAIHRKLRDQVVAALRRKGFAQAAVEECRSEILENVEYSILALVRTAA